MIPDDREATGYDDVTQLWHKFQGQVYGYLIKLGTPAETAEEIVVDAFLAAQRSWHLVRDFDRPEAFVYKVATNLSRWRYEKDRAWREQLTAEPPDSSEHFDDADQHALTETDAWKAVMKLPRRCREVIVLRYVEDFSVAETATVLGIGEGTVKRYAAEGRESLAKVLGSHDAEKGSR